MTPYEQIKAEIISLESALLSAHPQMPQLLQKIHRQLKNDPEIVTLLEESEIAIIVSGLQKQTQTSLVASLTKASASKKASLKKVTEDDLF